MQQSKGGLEMKGQLTDQVSDMQAVYEELTCIDTEMDKILGLLL